MLQNKITRLHSPTQGGTTDKVSHAKASTGVLPETIKPCLSSIVEGRVKARLFQNPTYITLADQDQLFQQSHTREYCTITIALDLTQLGEVKARSPSQPNILFEMLGSILDDKGFPQLQMLMSSPPTMWSTSTIDDVINLCNEAIYRVTQGDLDLMDDHGDHSLTNTSRAVSRYIKRFVRCIQTRDRANVWKSSFPQPYLKASWSLTSGQYCRMLLEFFEAFDSPVQLGFGHFGDVRVTSPIIPASAYQDNIFGQSSRRIQGSKLSDITGEITIDEAFEVGQRAIILVNSYTDISLILLSSLEELGIATAIEHVLAHFQCHFTEPTGYEDFEIIAELAQGIPLNYECSEYEDLSNDFFLSIVCIPECYTSLCARFQIQETEPSWCDILQDNGIEAEGFARTLYDAWCLRRIEQKYGLQANFLGRLITANDLPTYGSLKGDGQFLEPSVSDNNRLPTSLSFGSLQLILSYGHTDEVNGSSYRAYVKTHGQQCSHDLTGSGNVLHALFIIDHAITFGGTGIAFATGTFTRCARHDALGYGSCHLSFNNMVEFLASHPCSKDFFNQHLQETIIRCKPGAGSGKIVKFEDLPCLDNYNLQFTSDLIAACFMALTDPTRTVLGPGFTGSAVLSVTTINAHMPMILQATHFHDPRHTSTTQQYPVTEKPLGHNDKHIELCMDVTTDILILRVSWDGPVHQSAAQKDASQPNTGKTSSSATTSSTYLTQRTHPLHADTISQRTISSVSTLPTPPNNHTLLTAVPPSIHTGPQMYSPALIVSGVLAKWHISTAAQAIQELLVHLNLYGRLQHSAPSSLAYISDTCTAARLQHPYPRRQNTTITAQTPSRGFNPAETYTIMLHIDACLEVGGNSKEHSWLNNMSYNPEKGKQLEITNRCVLRAQFVTIEEMDLFKERNAILVFRVVISGKVSLDTWHLHSLNLAFKTHLATIHGAKPISCLLLCDQLDWKLDRIKLDSQRGTSRRTAAFTRENIVVAYIPYEHHQAVTQSIRLATTNQDSITLPHWNSFMPQRSPTSNDLSLILRAASPAFFNVNPFLNPEVLLYSERSRADVTPNIQAFPQDANYIRVSLKPAVSPHEAIQQLTEFVGPNEWDLHFHSIFVDPLLHYPLGNPAYMLFDKANSSPGFYIATTGSYDLSMLQISPEEHEPVTFYRGHPIYGQYGDSKDWHIGELKKAIRDGVLATPPTNAQAFVARLNCSTPPRVEDTFTSPRTQITKYNKMGASFSSALVSTPLSFSQMTTSTDEGMSTMFTDAITKIIRAETQDIRDAVTVLKGVNLAQSINIDRLTALFERSISAHTNQQHLPQQSFSLQGPPFHQQQQQQQQQQQHHQLQRQQQHQQQQLPSHQMSFDTSTSTAALDTILPINTI